MKKKLLVFLTLIILGVQSFAAPYDQCGGMGWTGRPCTSESTCVYANAFFSQCLPCPNLRCDGQTTPDPGQPADPNGPNPGVVKFQREVLTGQKLVVTAVNGQAAINAGIKIGQILSLDTSATIKAAITSNLKDCYRIICYTGGECNCTSIDWTICVSGGCPAAGTSC